MNANTNASANVNEPRARSLAPKPPSTFPAGYGLALLTVSWAVTRLFANAVKEDSRVFRIATFAGVAGTLLALVATLAALFEPTQPTTARTSFEPATRLIQLALVAPLVAFVLGSVAGDVAPPLRLAALVSAASVVLVSLLTAAWSARSVPSAALALVALGVGESTQFASSAVVAQWLRDATGAHRLTVLGALGEVVALVGALCAVAWSYRSSVRLAGAARVRVFVVLAVLTGGWFLPTTLRAPVGRVQPAAAVIFGARFDLATLLAPPGNGLASKALLVAYAFVPVLVFTAANISMGAVGVDRAAGRRVLGWLYVLVAGFALLGASAGLRATEVIDPVQLVMVTAGATLLARAARMEVAARTE